MVQDQGRGVKRDVEACKCDWEVCSRLDPSAHASGLKLLCGAAGQDQTSCHRVLAATILMPSCFSLVSL